MAKKRYRIISGLLLSACLVLWLNGPLPPEAAAAPELKIYVSDVGQRDGMSVVFPDSTTMSIDCSGGDIKTLSHFHEDHCGGRDDDPPGYFHRNNVIPGDVVYSGDGVTVTCVASNGRVLGEEPIPFRPRNSNSENSWSMVLLVSYGGFDYLSGGDLTGYVERRLADVLLGIGVNVDIYKVHHHGSRYSSYQYFLDRILPEASVISVGDYNQYGHPTQDVLNRLYAVNSRIYQTERGHTRRDEDVTVANGTVLITTDGFTYTLENYGRGSNPFNDGPFPVDDPDGPRPTPTITPTMTPTPVPVMEGSPQLLIAEVAVIDHAPEDHDWIELYLPPGAAPIDLSNLYWTDLDYVGRLAKNGSLTLSAGDVVIVHITYGRDESDATGKGTNSRWDVYTNNTYGGSDDNQFVITTENHVRPGPAYIIDAVVWSDDSGWINPNEVHDGNYLISAYHWGDPVADQGRFSSDDQGPAIGDIDAGFARRVDTQDTNSVTDWEIETEHSQGTPPPMAPLRVNFQPASSRIPEGFFMDDGSQGREGGGYGWQ